MIYICSHGYEYMSQELVTDKVWKQKNGKKVKVEKKHDACKCRLMLNVHNIQNNIRILTDGVFYAFTLIMLKNVFFE